METQDYETVTKQ